MPVSQVVTVAKGRKAGPLRAVAREAWRVKVEESYELAEVATFAAAYARALLTEMTQEKAEAA